LNEYKWLSPEKVFLNFNLAGVGSRFAACFIDTIFQVILIMVIFFGFEFFLFFQYGWFYAITLLIVFVIFNGYYILFETLWNGQTPGKRIINIRVIQTDGSSVTFVKVLIRNIVRVIDSLPLVYGVGMISVFASQRNQRLGDMAAGTLVIKENVEQAPTSIDLELKDTPWAGVAKLNIHKISEDDFAVLKKYLLRRNTLELYDIVPWDKKLTQFFSEKLSLTEEEAGDSYEFLKQVAALYQNR
jgi:uncharacterized RDD family membrane protein YckC